MLERQAEGIDKAKAEGKYKGRKATARMKAPEIVALFQAKQTVAEIVRTTGTASGSSVETTLNALDAFAIRLVGPLSGVLAAQSPFDTMSPFRCSGMQEENFGLETAWEPNTVYSRVVGDTEGVVGCLTVSLVVSPRVPASASCRNLCLIEPEVHTTTYLPVGSSVAYDGIAVAIRAVRRRNYNEKMVEALKTLCTHQFPVCGIGRLFSDQRHG